MSKIKIKHLLYIFMLSMIFTIFFNYTMMSFYDYKFIINITGVILKNIAIIGFSYKVFTDRNVQKSWRELLES